MDPSAVADVPSARRHRLPAVTVRARLTIVITLVTAIGLLSVGGVVYAVQRQNIAESVDDRLTAQLDSARTMVSLTPDGGWTDAREALTAVMRMLVAGETSGAIGIVDGDVALVPGVPLPVDPGADADFVELVVEETSPGDPVIGQYGENGVVWRYLATPVVVEGDDASAVFVLVYDMDLELGELDLASRAYLITAAIALAVVAAASWLVATRLLRPLRRMRLTAERVSALSLDERLPVHGRDDVSELANTMNGMLDRLDDAMVRQRRLLGDVGHELKTPITIVHGYLEVMDALDAADVDATRALAVDELERMGRLVGDLVGVACLQDDQTFDPRPTALAALLEAVAAKATMIEGARVRLGPVADAEAEIDDARVTQALLQLAQNAVTHGGGDIELSATVRGDVVEIAVRDHGPGVPDGEKARVFERFQRGSGGGRGSGGSGIGLDVVRLIADLHGGDIRLEDAPGGGARFVLTVPLARVPAGQGAA